MKRVLLSLLVLVLVLGVVAAAGFTGYRLGYAQGVQATANGDVPAPRLFEFERIRPDRMPMHVFGMERGFHRGFGMGGFPMMGFGFFSLFRFLFQLAGLALIVWFVYWLFTRGGYRITRTAQTIEPAVTQTPPPETEAKE